jgi:hypothetical protein
LRVDRRFHLAAVEAWVPPSPSAAPAAGGWEKPVSRRVYSVGIGRSPAGGAWEVVVLRVQILKLAWIPFGGAAPWSSAVMRAASRSSGIFGLLEFFSPRPGLGVRRIWVRLLWRMVQQVFAAAPAASAVVSSEAVYGDFPSATWWAPTIQGLGSFGSNASATAPVSSSSPGSRGLRCFFTLFWVYL